MNLSQIKVYLTLSCHVLGLSQAKGPQTIKNEAIFITFIMAIGGGMCGLNAVSKTITFFIKTFNSEF